MARPELVPLVCSGLEVVVMLVGKFAVGRLYDSHAAVASVFALFSMYALVALAALIGFVVGLAALVFASDRRIVAATALTSHGVVSSWVVWQLSARGWHD